MNGNKQTLKKIDNKLFHNYMQENKQTLGTPRNKQTLART
jgi:hypothetical protein